MLGLSHPGAIELAQRLVDIAPPGLSRVFYSDNGSTAAEVALKMAFQYWRHRGEPGRNGFICLRDAYHGDTIGSVSVGGIELFHACFGPLLFQSWQAEPGDAGDMAALLAEHAGEVAAVIVEPLVQGAAGILTHPDGLPRAPSARCATSTTCCSSATRSRPASGAPARCSPASTRASRRTSCASPRG